MEMRCPHCGGKGTRAGHTCPLCHGTGNAPVEEGRSVTPAKTVPERGARLSRGERGPQPVRELSRSRQ